MLEVLGKRDCFSEKLRGSVLVLDGFTGFTPVQMKVVKELLAVCSKVLVTVTMDVQEPFMGKEKSHQLFYMSHKMIRGLCELTKETEELCGIKAGEKSRFAHSPDSFFYGKNLFRLFAEQVYKQEQKEISIFLAGTR